MLNLSPKLRTRLARVIMVALLICMPACDGCDGCDDNGSGGGSTTPADPIINCYDEMHIRSWNFATPTSSGTMTFTQSFGQQNLTGITQSSCPGMTVSSATSNYVGTTVTINYTVVCAGTSYHYTMNLQFVDGDCATMSGTRTGNYTGGITENIALTIAQ